MSHAEKIREFVVNNFLFGDGSRLQNDTSFLESGIIDSTGILEVITYIEETFGIKVNDDELLPENLDSVDNIVGFISRKTGCAA
ncbi:MAG: acyl carrier protein [Chitinispirillaceae bacterium]|nr:acyl carrier protein [Chitinispirillaceae bacterium]